LSAIKAGLIPLLYAGILSVGVAFTLQTVAQKRSDPTTAAIIFSTESVFGTIGGAVVLHEVMSFRAYMGCIVMFIGLVLSQLDMEAILKRLKNNKENAQ
jgi:drug/metabolite transporter (DMT)-like permease